MPAFPPPLHLRQDGCGPATGLAPPQALSSTLSLGSEDAEVGSLLLNGKVHSKCFMLSSCQTHKTFTISPPFSHTKKLKLSNK